MLLKKAFVIYLAVCQAFIPSTALAGDIENILLKALDIATDIASQGNGSKAPAESPESWTNPDAPKNLGEIDQIMADFTNQINDPEHKVKFGNANARLQSLQPLTEDELFSITDTLAPFLQYTERVDRYRLNTEILVEPGQTVTLDFAALCLDPMRSAPNYGKSLSLVPVDKFLDKDGRNLYQQALKHNQLHPDQRAQTQNIVRGIWHAQEGLAWQTLWTHQLSETLNQAFPGGVAEYRAYLDKVKAKKSVDRKPIKAPSFSEVSHLSDGVVFTAKDMSGTADHVKAEITNTSDRPFSFKPAEFAVRSDRDSDQLLALTGPKLPEEALKLYDAATNILSTFARTLADRKLFSGETARLVLEKGLVKSPVLQQLLKESPLLGNGISLYEAVTGVDMFTGQPLNSAARLLAAMGTVPGYGTIARLVGVKQLPALVESALKRSNRVFDASQGALSKAVLVDSVYEGAAPIYGDRTVEDLLDEFKSDTAFDS